MGENGLIKLIKGFIFYELIYKIYNRKCFCIFEAYLFENMLDSLISSTYNMELMYTWIF